jgi:hypothetical protein
VAVSGSAFGQQKTLKEQLIGTWRSRRGSRRDQTASKLQRNGHVYILFSHPDLPKVASNNPSTPTTEEAKGIVDGAIAYYGTYSCSNAAASRSIASSGR